MLVSLSLSLQKKTIQGRGQNSSLDNTTCSENKSTSQPTMNSTNHFDTPTRAQVKNNASFHLW